MFCMLTVGVLTGCGDTGSKDTSNENTSEEMATGETIEGETDQERSIQGLGDREHKSQDESSQTDVSEEKSDEKTDKPITMADLLNESGNTHGAEDVLSLPETVLWFNATYAALTYSNGWNWRLVGGLEPTEENVEITKTLLFSSWNVRDRESALETVDNLITKGHRGKCQECMDELEEWGFLELEEDEFIEKLLDMDIDGKTGRYVITYYMYVSGIEPEYLAAFDLCRVNQLYADYYICGFMDYEEAMDASLENSLALQKMYDSWEEMMDAYMLGFQFWQGDFAVTEDSPTRERYHYYEMLCGLEDNPYTFDWDMKLEKSW